MESVRRIDFVSANGNATAINMWLETAVFQLIKHYAQLKHKTVDKIHVTPTMSIHNVKTEVLLNNRQ